jgi:hypothetical protein
MGVREPMRQNWNALRFAPQHDLNALARGQLDLPFLLHDRKVSDEIYYLPLRFHIDLKALENEAGELTPNR